MLETLSFVACSSFNRLFHHLLQLSHIGCKYVICFSSIRLFSYCVYSVVIHIIIKINAFLLSSFYMEVHLLQTSSKYVRRIECQPQRPPAVFQSDNLSLSSTDRLKMSLRMIDEKDQTAYLFGGDVQLTGDDCLTPVHSMATSKLGVFGGESGAGPGIFA